MLKSLLLSISIALMFTGCVKIGQGEKIGRVVKINEESGFINKTVEVEIMRGGFSDGSGVNGNSLQFTVTNSGMLEKLKIAMDQGKEVKIYWSEYLIGWFTSDSHNIYGSRAEFLTPGKVNKVNNFSNYGLNNQFIQQGNTLDKNETKMLLNVLKVQNASLITQNQILQKLIEKD